MSLPRLDVSTLSHNAAKWPLPYRVLLGCLLVGLVLLVGEVLYLSPSRERLQGDEARGHALQQQLAEKTQLATSLEARTEHLRAMEDKFVGLLRQLPAESEVPGLLEDVARLAVANGVWVEGITLLEEEPHQLYTEQSVQMGATGAYHDLAAFVSALAGLLRVVTVQDVTLRPEGALLRLEMVAKTYRGAIPSGQALQALEPGPRFVYDPSTLRDPFRSPTLQAARVPGRPALSPDLTRSRGLLEGMSIDQFEMVGTLSNGVQAFALLRAGSLVHRLAVGDYLGPDHGQVTAIQDGYIELVELFPDDQGAWLERPRTLVLNVNS
ncbi:MULTISPECIES: pilus assembly protein PilP [Pseudomonas fluorescens group]|uniref:Pilus assembly protein, PilO n=1 Tax=Pseudomonas fluorescens TaxID=294 RepID=A0A0D0TR41_PSEFL|nr:MULTISPECIES: pilus assembly protein PilP [Pseudomonas fluorescens group]AZE58857.1 Type IV pilus biogenesis protein PilO [Pseudomonas synxantha]KIR23295.1 Pilus assembly protein, PilO [Pseudomonas fluorescens]